jgi:DeoR/GlpR family transcriptional regulator of sugar metabolism
MQADERQRAILARARDSGRVEVTSVAADLHVAAETVRRDLKVLEGHGLVRRTHGGAYPVESAGFESSLAHRSRNNVSEKRRIASAAMGWLVDAETVYVDEGFTPQLVAEELATLDRALTVVTASLPAATALAAAPRLTVVMVGGRVRGRTLATVDHWAARMLAELVIDVAFLGANGVSRDRGMTTPDPAVGAVKAAAVRAARRRVFVGTHTKFGAATFYRFAGISDFDALITDTALSTTEAHRYGVLGPQVVRV